MPDYKFNFITNGNRNQSAVLFLHGFMGRSSDWQDVMTSLADSYYTIAVDLPGHGATTTSDDNQSYTMEQTAAGLIHWLDEKKIDRCALVGYSMGSRLALYLAINYPGRFTKVALESSSPGLASESERTARIEHDSKLAAKLNEMPYEQFLASWYDQPLFASLKNNPSRLQNLIESRKGSDKSKLALSLRYFSTGEQPSLWESLEKVKLPMGLIVGQYDDKFIQIATEMTRRCPMAQMKVIDNAGHTVHYEQPEKYIDWLRSFLGDFGE